MCTMIATKYPTSASAKGADGWFEVDHLYLAYDHPIHHRSEHAVLIDFANEESDQGSRLAVEMSRQQALDLARRILETIEVADAYEEAAG